MSYFIVYTVGVLILAFLFGGYIKLQGSPDGGVALIFGFSILAWPIILPIYVSFLLGFYSIKKVEGRGISEGKDRK